jgi:peroxiredoxin
MEPEEGRQGTMRRLLTPVAVLAVAATVAIGVRYAFAPPATLVRAGSMAPDFSLPHYNQPTSKGTLSELRGSPVLLVRFDSKWRGTAVYLMELEKVHRRYLRDGLVVVGIALDPQEEQRALEFVLKNRAISFTVLLDPEGRVTGPLYRRARGQPETYLIDGTGRVVSVDLERQKWTNQLERIEALLPLPTPTPSPLDRPPPSG